MRYSTYIQQFAQTTVPLTLKLASSQHLTRRTRACGQTPSEQYTLKIESNYFYKIAILDVIASASTKL